MIEAEERALMEQTVRDALADAVASGAEAADVDAVLAKLGWLELLGEHPHDAVGIVFGALGATNATATALDDVLASALGAKPRPGLAVLLPRFGGWDPPGRIDGATLQAEGLASGRAEAADEILVAVGSAESPSLAAVKRSAATLRGLPGIDPHAGHRGVRLEVSAAGTRVDPAAWRAAIALARCAVAHQIAGASRAMLELARAHALERKQFGRPIARFQAVRHRLADALVAVESLEAALGAAREEPNADTAALAKAIAGRASHTVAGHCQQVLAGIGFTTEHPFERLLKRTLTLEGLFGSADAIGLDLGRRLLAERRVPTLLEL